MYKMTWPFVQHECFVFKWSCLGAEKVKLSGTGDAHLKIYNSDILALTRNDLFLIR